MLSCKILKRDLALFLLLTDKWLIAIRSKGTTKIEKVNNLNFKDTAKNGRINYRNSHNLIIFKIFKIEIVGYN